MAGCGGVQFESLETKLLKEVKAGTKLKHVETREAAGVQLDAHEKLSLSLKNFDKVGAAAVAVVAVAAAVAVADVRCVRACRAI